MDRADPSWPDALTINAWTGEDGAHRSPLAAEAKRWGLRETRVPPRFLVAAPPADPRDWRHEEVGWGLILPDNDEIPGPERAAAGDAPEPIRELLAARRPAPVLRYREEPNGMILRRYHADGRRRDFMLEGSRRGLGEQRLPRYLLIYGSPREVPWDLQYMLNNNSFVGRLDLTGRALENYVSALLGDWQGSRCSPRRPVVWSVNHGHPDITWLMHGAIARPVAKKLETDRDIGDELRSMTGPDATASGLVATLADRTPALVISTSHGMTGPAGAPDPERLGLPVDAAHQLVDPDALLAAWQPDGAIWYAHACCSAGSDSTTSFAGLVTAGSPIERTLTGIAGLGARIAPLPRRLLGAEKPLRAFIGQVEPTFDWTLRAANGQVLTETLEQALYDRMHQARPETIGMAFAPVYQHVGGLLAQWERTCRKVGENRPGAHRQAVCLRLTALDRQSMVILGDPTVALPSLASD